MTLELYNMVYIITNVLFSYTIFKFMRIFFNERLTNKKVEFMTYTGYFFVSTGLYLCFNIPIVLIISSNILIFLLSFNYISTIKKRFLATISILLMLLCIEIIVVTLTSHIGNSLFSQNDFGSTIGIVLIRGISFIIVLMISGFKNIKASVQIPTAYWLSVFLIPFSSIVIILILLNLTVLNSTALIICTSLLMLINIMTFYLYDKIIISAENKTTMLLSLQQNAYYEKHIDLMKSSMAGIRILRHDLKNQLFAILAMTKSGNIQSLTNHIELLIGESELTKVFANSGNTNIDSILNFKLFEAERAGIQTSLLLQIPDTIKISSVDLCSILGNLIDNAICATCKLDIENRKINITLRYNKKRIIINISNTFTGKIVYDGDKLESSHKNKDEHGLGLLSVKNAVERCDGIMDIAYTANTFVVSVIMPT